MKSARIQRLRDQSISAKPALSIERAQLLTEFYKQDGAKGLSIPVARAKAFEYILKNKTLYIDDYELIVGERGPKPAATPTYPEICVHTTEDLKILDSREKISFSVSKETQGIVQNDINPFWEGKTIRDKIFEAVDPEWKEAYEAGVFTEFMEQRAPGHTVGGKHIFFKGFNDFKDEIQESLESLDFKNDPEAFEKREELLAMSFAADAIIHYAHRYATLAEKMAAEESHPARKDELLTIAKNCQRVPANAPGTMWEALQHYWFIHLGVITELNTWDSFNPGRLDQNLFPYFQEDLNKGTISKDFAKELLQSFWVKFNNQPAPPKVGVTAEESNTYTDFCLINVGGVKENGTDAVNELSYLILDVIEEMRILQPSSMVQISKNTPKEFLQRVLEIIKTGFGQPSIFNTDAIVKELTRQGKSLVDARNGGASGCVEAGAFGKEAYILTGYFNLMKILELTLYNGTDPRTGKTIGIQSGDLRTISSFGELYNAFEKQLNYFTDIKIKGNKIIEKLWAKHLPAPFMSIITKDCIANGKDYNGGGARYNTSYIQGVGIGSITDALTSVCYNVFDKKLLTLDELLTILGSNYENNEVLREKFLYDTPKYGNDDDYADAILARIFESYYNAIDGVPNARGGCHRINLLPTTVHVYFGSVIGAMPDGHKAYEPLSEGISPVQGSDRKGPTAVIKSASKIDHVRTGGTLLNQKFTPMILHDPAGIEKVASLIRAYFRMEGHHIQFNVVTAETLRKAQEKPEDYRNLIVRVAGYSDYFINLGVNLQNEIIRRTEHLVY